MSRSFAILSTELRILVAAFPVALSKASNGKTTTHFELVLADFAKSAGAGQEEAYHPADHNAG
jgi:hypothetical protein